MNILTPTRRLRTVVDRVIDHRGLTPAKLGSEWDESRTGIPAVSAMNIKQNRLVKEEEMNYVSPKLYELWMRQKVVKGDLLLTSEAPLGEMYIVRENDKLCLSQRVYGLRVKQNILNSKFLYYVLSSKQGQYRLYQRSSGSTAKGIRATELMQVEVELADINVQNQIVNYLDQKVARIDEAIAKKKQLLQLLEEKRESTIQKNIYRKGTQKRKFKFIASLVYGDSLPNEIRNEGGIPVFGSFGQVGLHDKANTKSPVLIIGRKGSYGKVMYSEVPVFVIDTAYFIDLTTSKCSLRWLYYVLRVADFEGSSLDTGVPGLSREFAHNCEIPYYDTAKQEKIASSLDKKMQRFDNVQESIKKSIELLEEYKTSLISNAVTGRMKI